jgi:outer membrane protein assembly factor BamD
MESRMRIASISRAWSARRPLLIAACVLALAACGTTDDTSYVERPVDELYNLAMDDLTSGNPAQAARSFDEVERQHPYSVWARRAQIMSAYSHYLNNAYDDAILAAQRFIQLHPGNPDVPYAQYLIATCYYEQITDVGRDQRMTQRALESLQEIVERYPDSQYARDARLKMELAHDHLAGKEMAIGRYYEERGQYVAAINRYRAVIEHFQTTTHVPEALHRLTESYLALGVVEEAQKTAAVLGHNFPGSEWYQDSYAMLTGEDTRPKVAEKSWVARLWDSVF